MLQRLVLLVQWVGFVIGPVIYVGSLYFDSQDAREFGWSWQVWAIIGMVVFFASAVAIIAGLWRENSEFKKRPRPNVVFDGFNDNPAQYQTEWSMNLPDGSRNQRLLLAEFRRARFTNCPVKRGEGAAANQVCGRIEFWDESVQNRLLEVRDGRWADLPELHQTGANIKGIDLSAAGESGTLDIVTKGHEEAECYGWNNSGRVGPGLGPGMYQICVRIAVANEGVGDRDFWFTLTNPGEGEMMKLQERIGFENPCSNKWAAEKSVPNT